MEAQFASRFPPQTLLARHHSLRTGTREMKDDSHLVPRTVPLHELRLAVRRVLEAETDCHRLNQAMLTLAQGYVAENEIGTRESLEDVALIRAVADRDATPDWLRRSSIDFIRIIEGYRGPLFQNGNGGRMDQVEK